MGKEVLVMVFGVWVALQSFLGLPRIWDEVIFVILGLSILGLGVLLRRGRMLHNSSDINQSKTFVENTPSHGADISNELNEPHEDIRE